MLRTLGYVETIPDDEGVALVFQGHEGHVNDLNTVQGGILTAWMDVAMTCAVFDARDLDTTVSTLEIKTTYLAPVPPEVPIRVEGRIVRLGRRIGFLEARVRDEKGTVLASATSTALLGTRAPPATGPAGG